MRSIRFWILMTGSLFLCLLYLEQIYLSRAIYQQQQVLIDRQQIIVSGQSCESSWKVLAARVYQGSLQDKALVDVLKQNQIAVHVNKAAPSDVPGETSTKAPAPPQSKSPVGP